MGRPQWLEIFLWVVTVVFCCIEQVFDILSLCLHTSLSSAARLSATKPPSFVKSCSIWILVLPLVGLPFILPSIINFHTKKTIMSQNMANPPMFPLPNTAQSSFTLLRTSSLVALLTVSSSWSFPFFSISTLQRLLNLLLLKTSYIIWNFERKEPWRDVKINSSFLTDVQQRMYLTRQYKSNSLLPNKLWL